jgi:HAD superfamily hydrolase (TIGR01549 family)
MEDVSMMSPEPSGRQKTTPSEQHGEIKGVIFDLGHTLMHLNGTWSQVFSQGAADLAAFLDSKGLGLDGQAFAQVLLALREEGYARAKESLREVTADETMRRAFARFGMPEPGRALLKSSIDSFFAYEEKLWLADPEAIPVLHELAGQGLRLGLFSNATDDPFIQQMVDGLGFRSWLDPALSSAGTGIRKPDPAAFAPILDAWQLPPVSVVMVGDTLDADIVGGQRAGMRSVWIRSREDARQEGKDGGISDGSEPVVPDATILRLGELPACLEMLQGRFED